MVFIIDKLLLRLFILILIGFKSFYASECLDDCTCFWAVERYEANCSNRGFELYPPNSNTEWNNINIDAIDLTNNRLIDFPYQLSKIENLLFIDLTNNRIKRLKSNTLNDFKNLRTLFLNNNSLSTWSDLNPNTAFKGAKNLETLSIAYNPITSFSNIEETFLIVSHSIIVLDLSYCQITKLSGEYMLSGLTSIERLILDGNPLKIITPLISNTLKVFDLSNCNIELLTPDSLISLTNLLHLNLSHNSGIHLKNNLDEYVTSTTLLILDLSNCNLNIIEIEGFSKLSTLNFNENLLNKLTETTFENNPLLEYIDLSSNSINYIETNTFNNLKLLKKLDLSYNVISQIDSDMFIMNNLLISLNLSKNYLSRFHKIIAHSLIHLYLNSNDISKIDPDALTSLKNISILDLSNNVFSTIPNNMESKTLEILDLSMCRLIKITNRTFIGFPELIKLDLSGNRLTKTPKVSYFQNNQFLKEIRLYDNLWDCKCHDTDFHEFYNFYAQRRMVGSRLKETPQCGHPTNSFDNTWGQTCKSIWSPIVNMGLPQKIWTIIFSAILTFTICLCFYAAFRRCFTGIKNYFNERARRRIENSYRETRRVNSTLLQQEGFQNAPNLANHMTPRESMPPCYEDALLMPKRNLSKSMVELNSTSNQQRKKAKLKRTSTNIDLENENNSIIDDHNRFYSEERLLDRDKERSASNVGYVRRQQYRQQLSDGNRLPNTAIINYDKKFPSAQIKSQNLQDFERIAIFKNSRASPYSSRKWKMHPDSISFASVSDDSLGIHKNTSIHYSKKNIDDIDYSLEKQKQSPYSRRRPRGMSVSQLSISKENLFDNDDTQSSTLNNNQIQPNQKIVVIENHFNSNNGNNVSPKSHKTNKQNDNIISNFNKLSTSSLDFDKIQMPSKDQSIESINSEISKDGMVVVNLPVKQSKF